MPRTDLNDWLVIVDSPRPAEQQTDSQQNGADQIGEQKAADGRVQGEEWRMELGG